MRGRRHLIRPLVALPILGLLFADPLPQPQISFTEGSAGTWNADWTGLEGRTIFTLWSLDLQTWQYAPFLDYGSGSKSRGISTSGASKFFVRLRCVDIPTTDAELADFDGDGISNIDELMLGTDPLDPDTDHDGVPDGVEVALGSNPLSNADGDPLRAMDTDGDGISDAVELINGTSPTLWDSDGDGYSDKDDAFPLDPTRHSIETPTSGDTTKPLVSLQAPANAVFVSGP